MPQNGQKSAMNSASAHLAHARHSAHSLLDEVAFLLLGAPEYGVKVCVQGHRRGPQSIYLCIPVSLYRSIHPLVHDYLHWGHTFTPHSGAPDSNTLSAPWWTSTLASSGVVRLPAEAAQPRQQRPAILLTNHAECLLLVVGASHRFRGCLSACQPHVSDVEIFSRYF